MIGMLAEDIEKIKQYLPDNITITNRKEKDSDRKLFQMIRFENLTKELRKLNCYNNKHIPTIYLRSSIEQRKSLLQGIMDTDGYCSKDGKCGIQLSNKTLTEDVLELITSLGIKATITSRKTFLKGKQCKDAYRICFMSEFPVFRLPRKIERQKMTNLRATNKRRYIINIRKIEPVPMQCLTVANDDGMYLVGKTFIPTHNSY
jgi:replicative DNA helicase